jgi:hypothetical protein
MATNLTIVLDNRPGAMAAVCEAVGREGINIEGMCCFASQGVALLYLTVEDGSNARRAVERLGVKVSEEREVALVRVEDKPGAAGAVMRRISDAGINVELAYLATGPRIVIGASDPHKVLAVQRS